MSLLSNLKPGLTDLEQLRALLAAGRQRSIHVAIDIALIVAGAKLFDVSHRLPASANSTGDGISTLSLLEEESR
jgi:hypothetical protein